MSEYEKALFRVYDRTLDGFWGDLLLDSRTRASNPSANGNGPTGHPYRKWCRAFEKVLAVSILFTFVLFCYLHASFVGNPGCLEEVVIASAKGTNLVIPNVDKNNTAENNEPDGLSGGVEETGGVISEYIVLPSGALLASDVILKLFAFREGPLEFNSSTEDPDYLFTAEPHILKLEESTRTNHNFRSLNVALDDKCFGSSYTRFFLVSAGFEVALINMLQNTLFSNVPQPNPGTSDFARISFLSGMLVSFDDPEVSWLWTRQSLSPRDGYSIVEKILLKISAVLRGIFTFFLLSTVTSIIVRILLSSGVALIFGIYLVLSNYVIDIDPGLLILSYSWLGVPFQHLREQSKPTGTFIWGHIMNVVVLYYMFNACQLAWSYTVYGKVMPSSLPMMIYGLMLLLEYFSLIYVRSIESLFFFPRFVGVVFVLWHTYFFYVPFGFFHLFLFLLCLVLFFSMIFTIKNLELPASIRGEVSLEHPRARYVELPWQCETSRPQPQPPIWTLFIPTNAESQSVYTRTVPGRPQGSNHRTREDDGGDNESSTLEEGSDNGNLNEGRNEEELQLRSYDTQQQQQQSRPGRYIRLNQTPDDIELGG